ncbi:MAG: response regulator transcription factor [Bdellovibrionales bacterium]|nr:response regulator transcription factor [Bdellovibrionales bacterium]
MNLPFLEVLLLEDEAPLGDAIQIAFQKMGMTVVWHRSLGDFRKGLQKLNQDGNKIPPLIVLDRTLPDGDGLEICQELRDQKYSGAILVLTASGDPRERVRGLRAGADDYLPKPFDWDELQARIEALSRRYSPKTEERILWTLEEERLRVLSPKGWVQLTPLEFRLVKKLIEEDGSIVSREELLRKVWGFRFLPQTRTVDFFMNRLRKRLEIDPEKPRHFITVRGAGYRFIRTEG